MSKKFNKKMYNGEGKDIFNVSDSQAFKYRIGPQIHHCNISVLEQVQKRSFILKK